MKASNNAIVILKNITTIPDIDTFNEEIKNPKINFIISKSINISQTSAIDKVCDLINGTVWISTDTHTVSVVKKVNSVIRIYNVDLKVLKGNEWESIKLNYYNNLTDSREAV